MNYNRKEKNTLREELKSINFIIKDLFQTTKEIKTKSIPFQSISSCMSSFEVNLLPPNLSVSVEDVYNNNDEIADTNNKFLFSIKKQMIMIYSKNPCKTNLKEWLERKKEKLWNSRNIGQL